MLKVYFDYDEWSAVEDLHKVKVRSCNCKKNAPVYALNRLLKVHFVIQEYVLTVIQLVFTTELVYSGNNSSGFYVNPSKNNKII